MATAKKTPAKNTTAAPEKTAAPAAKRAPNAGFMKPHTPSAELAAIVGKEPLPRTEVTKLLWAYIKKHDLQDSANRRNINADDKLKKIFGQPQVTMFQMTALVSKHLK